MENQEKSRKTSFIFYGTSRVGHSLLATTFGRLHDVITSVSNNTHYVDATHIKNIDKEIKILFKNYRMSLDIGSTLVIIDVQDNKKFDYGSLIPYIENGCHFVVTANNAPKLNIDILENFNIIHFEKTN